MKDSTELPILAYLEGTLSPEEANALEHERKNSPYFDAELREYGQIHRQLITVATEEYCCPDTVLEDVMQQVLQDHGESEGKFISGVLSMGAFLRQAARSQLAIASLICLLIASPYLWFQSHSLKLPTGVAVHRSIPSTNGPRTATYNDARIASATNVILTHVEGSFGALFMVISFLCALGSALLKRYKLAAVLLLLAIAAFGTRSLVGTLLTDQQLGSVPYSIDSGGAR